MATTHASLTIPVYPAIRPQRRSLHQSPCLADCFQMKLPARPALPYDKGRYPTLRGRRHAAQPKWASNPHLLVFVEGRFVAAAIVKFGGTRGGMIRHGLGVLQRAVAP